ncbi:aconitase family protein, partial [Salmonella enterica]|uniref:aconitase family protein n=1 Tax=Salmonella enterica TaxID=28901 RepID=UPI00398C24B0
EVPAGTVVIAASSSCTNNPNPSVLRAEGLLAKKAVTVGWKRQPWVNASLAPGSKVVSDYLAQAKLTPYLDELGFNLVGYGCTTCIGNYGQVPEPIEPAIKKGDLTGGAGLSGNRNLEGSTQPRGKKNRLG